MGDEQYDKKLARHLVSLYYKDQSQQDEDLYSMDILRDYVKYAKQSYNPVLSDAAGQQLIENYVEMRKIGAGRGQITAYPRQLESLIRLAEAHARLRFSHNVEVVDVEEASRLHKEALKQSAIDPTTGTIDVSILTTGQSSAGRKRRFAVKNNLKDLVKRKGKVNTINYQKTWNELKHFSELMIKRDMFEDALKDLSDDNVITLTGRATIRVNHSRE